MSMVKSSPIALNFGYNSVLFSTFLGHPVCVKLGKCHSVGSSHKSREQGGGGGIEEQASSTSILGQTDLTEGGIRELPLPADTKSMQ